MRLMIVGAGAVTRDLLRNLSDAWEVTVVDADPDLLLAAADVRPITAARAGGTHPGDLREAGLESADAFVAATPSDDSNLAACRLAQESGVAAFAAVAADPERLSEYRELSVAAFSPDRLAARRVETNLEPRRVSSAEFAEGQAEAMEFRIARDSPLRGKALQNLDFTAWLVVAVLRGDRMIVPHGSTVLERDDLVTVVGDAARSAEMVAVFTEGRARFPTDFGSKVTAVFDGGDAAPRVAEAAHLVRHSAADGMALLHGPDADPAALVERVRGMLPDEAVLLRSVPDPRLPVSAEVAAEVDAAAVVVELPVSRGLRGRRQAVRVVRYAQQLGRPVLVARGNHPYRNVVVQARPSAPALAAAGAAVDLAAIRSARLVVVAVTTPPFIAGPDTADAVRAAAARIREEAAVREVAVQLRAVEGNPVRAMAEAAGEHSLLVVGVPERAPTIGSPGAVAHLVQRARCSVLLVPGRS